MSSQNQNISSAQLVTGRILSGLVVAALLADATVNLFAPHLLAPTMEAEGFPVAMASWLGLIMLSCAALYALPRTAVLGAILITGFFGGAICVHFRLGALASPPQIICLFLAAMAWAGLYLRDARLRALVPMRAVA
jgi:hypothetical protein